jgi:hypothetical protein
LAILDLEKCVCHHWDSLSRETTQARQDEIVTLLQTLVDKNKIDARGPIRFQHEPSSIQSNCVDCGVFTCINAIQWVLGTTQPVDCGDIEAWRLLLSFLLQSEKMEEIVAAYAKTVDLTQSKLEQYRQADHLLHALRIRTSAIVEAIEADQRALAEEDNNLKSQIEAQRNSSDPPSNDDVPEGLQKALSKDEKRRAEIAHLRPSSATTLSKYANCLRRVERASQASDLLVSTAETRLKEQKFEAELAECERGGAMCLKLYGLYSRQELLLQMMHSGEYDAGEYDADNLTKRKESVRIEIAKLESERQAPD